MQALKIDRSFVKEILHGAEDAAIAAAIINLGKNLNLEIIAEGVEDLEQAEHLAQAGCECAQGYHFGRPATAEDSFSPRLELTKQTES